MKTFVGIRKFAFKNIEKAYVEGIYQDSPANRKLGRVGMSYEQYEKKLENEKETKPSEKREIPESLKDLDFNKIGDNEWQAQYKLNNKKIQVKYQINSNKRKIFEIEVLNEKNKLVSKFEKLDTDEMGKKLRLLNIEDNEYSDLPLQKQFDKMFLTPEELYKKWGYWHGFRYRYAKGDYSIGVVIKEGSTKGEVLYNIYILDTKTNKKKQITNLTKDQVHNELLKFELNSSIDRPMTVEQEIMYKKELQKEKYGDKYEEYKKSSDYISPIFEKLIFKYKNGIPQSEYKKDNLEATISNYSGRYVLNIIDKNTNKKSEFVGLKLDELSRKLDNLDKEELKNSKVNSETSSENIANISFDKYGEAYYKNEDGGYTHYRIDPKDKNYITITKANKDGYIVGVRAESKNNLAETIDNLELNTNPSNKIPARSVELEPTKEEAKYIVESYRTPEDITQLGVIGKDKDFDYKKYSRDLERLGLSNNSFDKGRIKAYIWNKEGEMKNWLNTLPESNKYSKEEIEEDLKNKLKRPKNSDLFDKKDLPSIKLAIIRNYF